MTLLNRRQFSQGVAATALTATTLNAAKPAAGWIDAHSHIWTRDIQKFPLAAGQTLDDLAPPSFTDDELWKLCSPLGVDRVVLIQHHIYHGWDNSYLVDAAKRFPDRYRVVGMVDDLSKDPAGQMKKLASQQVRGIRITPRIRGADVWLDGEGMEAMWKCGAETGQAMCCLIDASDLPAVEKMTAKHSGTPVVIDHFARIGVDGKIREKDLKQLCALARYKNVAVKISAYYALGQKKPPYRDLIPMIRRMLDAYGPERLMWASDAPYQVVDGHSYKASLDLIREGIDFIDDNDRQWLLRKTAQRVYFG